MKIATTALSYERFDVVTVCGSRSSRLTPPDPLYQREPPYDLDRHLRGLLANLNRRSRIERTPRLSVGTGLRS
jgi:hypothetical protein